MFIFVVNNLNYNETSDQPTFIEFETGSVHARRKRRKRR